MLQKHSWVLYFNPLPPHGGRRRIGSGLADSLRISIHSLRMEGDFLNRSNVVADILFQSTPSAWRETMIRYSDFKNFAFQSTPSAWRETLSPAPIIRQFVISIHSLRMEGDQVRSHFLDSFRRISIHSLRMEGDYESERQASISIYDFNPLPPHGGRQALFLRFFGWKRYFNPLPPHGGRQTQCVKKHAISVFQSTPSAWRETREISRIVIRSRHFNPLPPHGGRPQT